MIKRLIFDLDNTLIPWSNDYFKSLNKTLEYFNIEYDENIKNSLIKVAQEYEKIYEVFDYNYMNDLMIKYSNINLPNNFALKWTEYLEEEIPSEKDLNLIGILEYLSSKYELVVLTNWFTKQQTKRLENYGILKYFKEVIGTDKLKNKPNKETFIKSCEPYSINECIVIGDSLINDVNGAVNAGIRAILFDYKNNYNGNIENIKNINELKNIL